MYDKSEDRAITRMILKWGAIIIGLVLVGSFIAYLISPTLFDIEARGMKKTNEYVTTKQALLLDLVADYRELDVKIAELRADKTNVEANVPIIKGMEAQQKAIINQIKREKANIAPDQVPSEVSQLLAGQ